MYIVYVGGPISMCTSYKVYIDIGTPIYIYYIHINLTNR